jgi:uncharacterized protein with HEPN domain
MATKRAPRQEAKQAPRQKKLRTAGFSNPNALKLGIRTPSTLRRCLGWGLFGSGIAARRGHHEMSIAHSKQLIERYPSLYRLADAPPVPSSPPFAREGFACGDGWFKIVDRLSAKLSADPNLVIGQIKEKLGLLRIYFEPSPLPPDEIEEATDAALAEAVAESRVTCEWCGRPGKHAQREGRWSIMCGACAAKDARRRLKELLSPWMERLLALREKTVFRRSKLLAASRDQSRLDLTPEHALALLEKYPGLFREAWVEPKSPASPFARGGFEICDGWFSIVARLSAKLAKDTALHVVQVKEKYGRLKVYCGRDPSVPQDPRLDAELEAAIAKAADESERTCEVCGEPGTHEERHRWWSVRCGPCVQIDEMVTACERIAKCTEGLGLATFSANKDAQDAVRLAMVNIGHAAAGQPPTSRARLPGINWEKMERLKEKEAAMGMSTKELWSFARRQAPKLGRKLR